MVVQDARFSFADALSKREGVFSLQAVIPVVCLLVLTVMIFILQGQQGDIALSVSYFVFFIFHLHVCFSLTFDGFTRFSRYGISQKHPIFDKVLSIMFIVFCFLGLSPFALLHKAFSLYASPDEPEKNKAFYYRDYMISLVQSVVMFSFFAIYLFH